MLFSFMIRPATDADVPFVAQGWKDMIADGNLLGLDNAMPVEVIVSDIIANPFQIIDRTERRRLDIDIICAGGEGQDEEPIGFCETWTHAAEPVAEFHKVYILPKWRGSSIAAEVCKARMVELQENDGVVLFLLRVLSSPGKEHSAQQGAKLAKNLNMSLMPPKKRRKQKHSVSVAHYFIKVS